MTYITWKERQTNVNLFEKTLSFESKKYHSVKAYTWKERQTNGSLFEKTLSFQNDLSIRGEI